jgi:ABC-2 type transport system ATP-binding protein
MLVAESISKRFGDVAAVSDVSLAVANGEVVCLLGANGAGKTTMINLFLGFLTPDAGTVRVGGLDPAADGPAARRRVAYIPEDVALYPELSGLENLALFDGLLAKTRPAGYHAEMLRQAGLPAASADRRVSTYSKGMRQKVGLAIAFAKGAEILLLDEPLSGLDPKAANEFGMHLAELRERGCAVLMATHDIFRAKEIADRIGIMKAGRLVATLDASEMTAAEIERLYLEHMHDTSGEAA